MYVKAVMSKFPYTNFIYTFHLPKELTSLPSLWCNINFEDVFIAFYIVNCKENMLKKLTY